MKYYEIVKFYQDEDKHPRVLQRNYSLEEARKYCDDPELDSKTAKQPKGCGGDEKLIQKWNDEHKHWFVGFREQ